jgi:hypothetical protein
VVVPQPPLLGFDRPGGKLGDLFREIPEYCPVIGSDRHRKSILSSG